VTRDVDITPPYLSPEQRTDTVRRLAARAKGEVVSIGTSHAGESIDAVVVPSTRRESPRVLCTANIHGVEWISGLIALSLLEHLGADTSAAATSRDAAEHWIVPCLNPDGYRRTWTQRGEGAVGGLRSNGQGVDLNRNYPLPAGTRRRALPGAGSPDPGDATYYGPAPLSEPETQAIDALATARRFTAAAGLHSFMGTVIPARVTTAAHWKTYGMLARTIADAQSLRRYRRLASRWIDAWTGEQEDHLHHNHDCWAVCLETFCWTSSLRQHWRAPSTFWRFNPREPAPWIAQDVAGLVAYFTRAAALPRPSALV
jgi:predicted deacylase